MGRDSRGKVVSPHKKRKLHVSSERRADQDYGLRIPTYLLLREEFIYLSVLLDAYSRRIIGWALGRTLEAGSALSGLRMALAGRRPEPRVVHHSDRGVQYASHDHTTLLKDHEITISMTEKGTLTTTPLVNHS